MTDDTPRPERRPANPCFSSGPCAKRPGFSLAALEGAMLARSHRAPKPKARLAEVIARSAAVLELPADWRIGIVPGSDTGAIELAMWSLLGPRPVDVLAFESFSEAWAADITGELKLDARVLRAPYGSLPDLARIDPAHDLVLAWNGTTSGVRLPADGAFVADDRAGLVLCDATSAAFAMRLPYGKLDVVTWSWQKVLGGEAAHGMLALSPRAVERLRSHRPVWPMPKVFRLTDASGELIEGLFRGDTINTPSMLCVEDALDGLRWAERVGGLEALVARSEANLAAIAGWVERSEWAAFLAAMPQSRSCTSICLRIVSPWFMALAPARQAAAAKRMAAALEREGVAFDIASYRDAPPGLRIWGGATVETADILALLPWLDWAYADTAAAVL